MTPAPKRRWFQFGLGSMFLSVTGICIWLGWQLRIVNERKQTLRALEPLDVYVTKSPGMRQAILDYYRRNPERPRKSLSIPFYRELLGDEAVVQIATFGNYDEAVLKEVFPEAEVMYNTSRGLPGN